MSSEVKEKVYTIPDLLFLELLNVYLTFRVGYLEGNILELSKDEEVFHWVSGLKFGVKSIILLKHTSV